jgi:hypothetical protein
LINGLPDNEAQYLCVNNIFDQWTGNFRLVKRRLITKSAVSVFIEKQKMNGILWIQNLMQLTSVKNVCRGMLVKGG